jgi:hypothetical protein
MKIQFITIATLAWAASTVSAFSCPRNPLERVSKACMSWALDAANCNCKSVAITTNANCTGKCRVIGGKYSQRCMDGCFALLAKNEDKCDAKLEDFRTNGGGLDWLVEMGVLGVDFLC